MARITSLFLLCLFSFSAIAQSDVTISFAGVPLQKGTNRIAADTAIKNPKLATNTLLYKPSCYASYLPARGDLVGPYKTDDGYFHPNILRAIEGNRSGGKLFLDSVELTNSNGRKRKTNSFLIILTE